MIIFGLWLKNWIYYIAQATLLFFTGYLIFLLITKGNNVDCGCFGSLLELSPIASIAKNIVMMLALFFIPRQYYSTGVSYGVLLIVSISLALPFVINPVGIHNLQGIEVDAEVDFSGLPALYNTNEKVDFTKGKRVVAFFSSKCSHCFNASKKLVLLDKDQKINNLTYIVGSKKEENLIKFLEDTEADFPVIWMNDDEFFKYSGGSLPAIVYIEDGKMKRKWLGSRFDVNDIRVYFTN